jgi:hypothetical protein
VKKLVNIYPTNPLLLVFTLYHAYENNKLTLKHGWKYNKKTLVQIYYISKNSLPKTKEQIKFENK